MVCIFPLVHGWIEPIPFGVNIVGEEANPVAIFHYGMTCEVGPGDAVWSPCRAPHWVDAYDETAFTLSIAFTDFAPEPDPNAEMLVL